MNEALCCAIRYYQVVVLRSAVCTNSAMMRLLALPLLASTPTAQRINAPLASRNAKPVPFIAETGGRTQ